MLNLNVHLPPTAKNGGGTICRVSFLIKEPFPALHSVVSSVDRFSYRRGGKAKKGRKKNTPLPV